MKSSHILLIGLGPLLVCPSVNAAVSGHIQARLVISAACQISNTPAGEPVGGGLGVLDFGSQGPSWNQPISANLDESAGSGTLQVSCNPSVRAFTVSINGGSNNVDGVRRLSNGSELIPYELSADPKGTARYDIGQQRNFSISSAAKIPIPIYGAVVAHPKALPAGIYRDTLMVTLDW